MVKQYFAFMGPRTCGCIIVFFKEKYQLLNLVLSFQYTCVYLYELYIAILVDKIACSFKIL